MTHLRVDHNVDVQRSLGNFLGDNYRSSHGSSTMAFGTLIRCDCASMTFTVKHHGNMTMTTSSSVSVASFVATGQRSVDQLCLTGFTSKANHAQIAFFASYRLRLVLSPPLQITSNTFDSKTLVLDSKSHGFTGSLISNALLA